MVSVVAVVFFQSLKANLLGEGGSFELVRFRSEQNLTPHGECCGGADECLISLSTGVNDKAARP